MGRWENETFTAEDGTEFALQSAHPLHEKRRVYWALKKLPNEQYYEDALEVSDESTNKKTIMRRIEAYAEKHHKLD
jgi:hypothetical protein